MTARKLDESQARALELALARCRELGYAVAGWDPDLVVESRGDEADRRLVGELAARGLSPVEEPDDAPAGLLTFSFFPVAARLGPFADAREIARPAAERAATALVAAAMTALFLFALAAPRARAAPWTIAVLGLVAAAAVYGALRARRWRLRLEEKSFGWTSLWESRDFPYADVAEVGLKADGRRERLAVRLKDGRVFASELLPSPFARAMRDEIGRRAARP